MSLQKLSINNLVRSASFFQHVGLSIVAVFLPIIAGTIAFYYDFVSVMYFAVAIIVCAFLISLKIKK